MADVVGGVEMWVVDPHRTSLPERHEGEALAIAGNEVQARLDRLDQLLVGRGRTLEDRASGDVHVRRIPLQM